MEWFPSKIKLALTLGLLYTIFLVDVLHGQKHTTLAKFEPPAGKYLFFIGQDMEATGGLKGYNDGYVDHFGIPSGFTAYTNLSPGENSYGYINKGIDGITEKVNWGAGDSCAKCYLDSQKYEYSALAIGLSMVNHEKKIAKGEHDELIISLAKWIKSLGRRPVFLRIGYEFDGWEWNHYKRKYYLKSWKRIHTIFSAMKVSNVAFVWQSKGNDSGQKILERWYPGDDLVDWCAYSYFANPDEEMLTFARKHKKPVFIAEAAPVREIDELYFKTQLSSDKIAREVWDSWFVLFFKTINDNSDVIKAFSYINTNWSDQPMWKNNPVFKNVDSRIQKSEYITTKWKEEISKPKYLRATPELWDLLEQK